MCLAEMVRVAEWQAGEGPQDQAIGAGKCGR